MKIKLGNLIEFITTFTGIKWLVTKINKGECDGCKRRKKILNELFDKNNLKFKKS